MSGSNRISRRNPEILPTSSLRHKTAAGTARRARKIMAVPGFLLGTSCGAERRQCALQKASEIHVQGANLFNDFSWGGPVLRSVAAVANTLTLQVLCMVGIRMVHVWGGSPLC